MREIFKSKTTLFLVLAVLTETILLILRVKGLHNSELLINVGQKIINGENPYIPLQPYGTFPGLIYWLINFLTFNTGSPFIFIVLNLIGVAFLVQYLVGPLNTNQLLLIISLILITSPIRALTANVQHTGIIIGSLLLGNYLLTKTYKDRIGVIKTCCGAFCYFFAIEIKPQIALPFIIIWIIVLKKYKFIPVLFGIGIFTHLLIDIRYGKFLEVDQFNVWQIMRNDKLTISEQTSIWKVLTYFTSNRIDWFGISFLLYIAVISCLIVIALKTQNDKLLKWSLIIPILTAYLHLYDLVVISIYICYLIISRDKRFGNFILFGLLVIPTRFNTQAEVLNSLVFLLGLAVYLICFWKKTDLLKLLRIILEIVIAYILVFVVSRLNLDLETRVSVQLSLALMIFTFSRYKYLWLLYARIVGSKPKLADTVRTSL